MSTLAEYDALVDAIGQWSGTGSVLACITSACIDVVVDLSKVPDELEPPPEAMDLIALLRQRIARGIGGEIVYDWPGATDWVKGSLPHSLAWGGTGPHAAMALATAGERPLVALNDRSAATLSLIPDGVYLAEPKGPVPAQDCLQTAGRQHNVIIFEFTEGIEVLGGTVPPRSSRVIVRTGDLGIEHDPHFSDLLETGRINVGAGLIGGFQCVPESDLASEYRRLATLAGQMTACGAAVVHFELAGYPTQSRVLDALSKMRGHITSVGMSESEFRGFFDAPASADALRDVAMAHDLRRLCVHSDRWAASATRDDPQTERQALMLGSLLASARAERGRACLPKQLPRGASLTPPDIPNRPRDHSGYAIVAVSTPYLSQPRTTLGMGDTFTAGCLWAWTHARPPSEGTDAALTGIPSGDFIEREEKR